ncbi:MAG TPA: GAF domain-containing protein, partial [Sulfuricurvum sp.]|nr:GAF domain-containing protein [Sulfuricurvum sp.]
MLQANKYITRFDRTLWATLALFTALLITFALYMYSEVNIDRAHQQLVHSRELSDELRQSSDDLTRMARTYVVTHDPIYKKYYQEIIDIRDGLVPRPLNYNNIYWDLVLADNKRPRPTQPPVAFMKLITKAGFTNQELAKLSEAKQYSDTLALSEYAAMYLADANNDDAALNRHKALDMLYDTSYHHAKYQIMKALSDFNTLSEKRTNDSLQSAKTNAFILRIVFILLSILFVFSLLRIFFLLKKILGGSLSQIYEHLFRLGNGDFTTIIDMQNVSQSSILNWILHTQQKLKKIDTMRATSEEKARRISNLYAALSQCNQAIVRCATKEELFTQTCHDIVTFGEMKMVWIGMYDESNKSLHPVAYAGNGTDYLEGLKISLEASSVFGRGPTGTAFREDRPFWCQDFQNDPATEPWHKRGEEFGWRASASLPLHLNGTVVGVFTVYSTHENAFDAEAQRLLTEMCSDISFALNGFEHEALRVNTQSELSSAYNLLSTIINTAPMRIFWKDLDLNYLGCNDVFAKDAGKETHKDVIGKDDYQMGWKEQAELYRADDRKIIESGIPKIFFDEPQTTPTGEKIWLSTSKVPLYGPDNNIMGVLGMYQDITQRKNAESALIESESRLQAIIQTEPECVKTVDSRCRLTQMNPAGLAMLEAQTLEEAQNHSLTDFLLPEYRAAFIDMH